MIAEGITAPSCASLNGSLATEARDYTREYRGGALGLRQELKGKACAAAVRGVKLVALPLTTVRR